MLMHSMAPSLARIAVVVLAAVAWLSAAPAGAQKLTEQAKSLALVPQDAAMYSVLMNTKDAYDAVVGSKAYARAKEIPSVGMALEQMAAGYEMATADPVAKGILAVVADGLSNEIFVYTDSSYIEFMRIYQQANMQGSLAQLGGLMRGEFGAEPDPTQQLKGVLDSLNDNVDKLKMFDMVIGMRVKNVDEAKGLVKMAEEGLKTALAEAEAEGFKGKLTREKVGGADMLVMKLDGSMVPWEEFPFDEIGEPGKYDDLIAKLKEQTLVVSFGVKDDFLLISVGDTNDHIAAMGMGKGLTANKEFARLSIVEGKKLLALNYLSKSAAEQTMDANLGPFFTMLSMIPDILPAEVDDMLRRKIDADIKELTKDIKSHIPKMGASLSVTAFTPRGFESHGFDWSENTVYDGSKPLTLLDHVGGDPIAYIVARGKVNPDDYKMSIKWLGKLDGYFSDIIEQSESPEEAAKYKKFRTEIDPLLARLDKANREMLAPATADNQSAVVLDAGITSTQWFSMMPESPVPLPMLELGIVFSVSDAELLKKGAGEYFAVAKEVVKKLHEVAPDEVPDIELPDPQTRELEGAGTVYYYLLPKDWGVDKRIAPNAGISDKVAVLTLAPLHTKRLLTKTASKNAGLLAQYKGKPLASAGAFNFPPLVDAALPWIEYGITVASMAGAGTEVQVEGEEGHRHAEGPAAIMADVRAGAEILKCFRGYSGVTVIEQDVQVTHGEWHFQDLK
jgi:hypothetical protein